MRTISRTVGRGDGDGLHVGVGGGDKGDKCLGNKEVSLSMLPSGSEDNTGAVV